MPSWTWPMLALLVAATLGGCTAPSMEDAGDTSLPEPVRYAFAAPVLPAEAPDGFGSEPSLLATGDGTLYVSSVLGSATARGDGVWKSTDEGRSWTYLGKADYPFGGGDSDLEALDSGRILLTGQWRPAAPPPLPGVGSPYVTGGESVYYSDDGGGTWIPNPVAGVLPAADRQWLASNGDDTVYFVFNDLATGLMVAKSLDGATTWLPPVQVPGTGSLGSAGFPNGIAGDPVVDEEGTLYIPYGPSIGGGEAQRLVRSADGQRFETLTIHETREGEQAGAIFGSLALDAAGSLHYAWAETRGGGMRIHYTHSRDGGDSWSAPVQVVPDTVTAAFPWILAGDAGEVAVGYYATYGSFLPDDAPDNASWVPIVSFASGVPESGAATFTAVAVTDAPNHVGPICTQGTGCSGGRLLGDFFEMAVLPDGRVAIVYVDDTVEGERKNLVAVQEQGPRLVARAD